MQHEQEFTPPAENETQSRPIANQVWLNTLLNRAIGLLVVVFVGGAIFTAYQTAASAHAQKPKKCGVDWMMWICGSDETFESILLDKLEESQKELEKEMKTKCKPFDFKEFDANDFQFTPIKFQFGK